MPAPKHLSEGKLHWSPCRHACPVHADVRSYIKYIAQGKYQQALEVIRERLPYATVCGRICHHPCEQNCRRRDVDEQLAVRELKRFVAEHPVNEKIPVKKVRHTKVKIAVIGGGPSGMSAALELAGKGYRPCIFEKAEVAGGIPMTAIPRFRLPREALQRDIDWILAHGIELKTGVRIGKDITINDLHKNGYEAVVVAAGMSKSRILPLPGVDNDRIFGVLEFLKALASGKKIDVGKNVLVIGGGNVACDAARSAVRLNCVRVRMICLENAEEMPAWKNEVDEALEEGIEIIHRRGPMEFVTDVSGKLTGLRHKKVTAVFDEDGRFCPSFDDKDIGITECDTVIFAIGQMVDPDFIKGSGIEVEKNGRLRFDPQTQQTNVDWIFACGEAVTPPGSVVQACAGGLRVAEAVDRYLQTGKIDIDDTLPAPIGKIDAQAAGRLVKKGRVCLDVRRAEERCRDFSPFMETLTEEQAVAEARRCMECGSGAETIGNLCVKCLTCVRLCPYGAPHVNATAHISRERCQACGICYSDCPANAIRMKNAMPETLAIEIGKIIKNLKNGNQPKIVAYICGRSASAAQCRGEISAGFANCAEIYLPNPGLLDSPQILRTLEKGADAVMIVVCGDAHEHHRGTSRRLRQRVERLRKDLEAINMNPERIQEFELPDHGVRQIREVLQQGLTTLESFQAGHQ